MFQRKTVTVLLLNAFLTSLVSAQYGSPVNNGNPGYGGTGVPSGDYGHKATIPSASGSDGNSEPEPFNFSYQVKDAPTYTDFKHEANSDGKRVTGAYSVLLPDGRNQVVTYTADENGYNAKVNYEGEARPQPGPQGGSAGGYAPSGPAGYASSAQGYQSAAPSYPSAAPSYPSAAPSYPSAAPSYPSAASSYPSASAQGYPSAASGYPSAASGYPSAAGQGYSSAAPSYPSAAPSGYPSAAGIKTSYAAPQPKNGGY